MCIKSAQWWRFQSLIYMYTHIPLYLYTHVSLYIYLHLYPHTHTHVNTNTHSRHRGVTRDRGSAEPKEEVSLPRRPIYPEAFDGDVRVLQVHTVREQRLHIVKVLGLELGDGGESVVVLLDQLGHEVLVERQLVVAGDHHLELVRETTCRAHGEVSGVSKQINE